MKLFTPVEVTPSLALHEIPPRTGKCQTGEIAKVWGEEENDSESTEARLRQRGAGFSVFVLHPPSPEAERAKHTRPLFIVVSHDAQLIRTVTQRGIPF